MTALLTLCRQIKAAARGDDDREQIMWLALFERRAANPSFARQTIGYHMTAARFASGHYLRAMATYDRYVGQEEYVAGEDGEEVSSFEFIADPSSVEAEAQANETSRALEAAIDELPANYRRIVRLMLAGYTITEIAAKLGTGKSNVSQQVSRAMAQLRERLNC